MRKIVLFAACFLLIAAQSYADIYEWTDEKGHIHVVDDLLNVPLKYRDKAKRYGQETPSQQEPRQPAERNAEQREMSDSGELFGDYPLEWWKAEFERMKNDISNMEKTIADKKRYVDVYLRGRRGGQIYKQEETAVYEEYKKQLPLDEERLRELKNELERFRKKAESSGVPRSIRE